MDTVLRGLEYCHCYIDDIIVTFPNELEHEKYLRAVFTRLRAFGLAINVAKFVFGESKMQYLGCGITKDGISSFKEYVLAVQNFPKPKNISELRRFLGIINFYRKFIPNAV